MANRSRHLARKVSSIDQRLLTRAFAREKTILQIMGLAFNLLVEDGVDE